MVTAITVSKPKACWSGAKAMTSPIAEQFGFAVGGGVAARHPGLVSFAAHLELRNPVRHFAHRPAVDEREVGDVAEVLRGGEDPGLDVDRLACGVGHAERFEFG